MKFLLLALTALLTFSCTVQQSRYSPEGDLYRYQQSEIDAVKREAYTQPVINRISRMPAGLRPTSDDFLTFSSDLNNDGKPDIIGTIDHYIFKENGTYPLFIMIKDGYGYKRISEDLRVSSFVVKPLLTTANGFSDLQIGDKILRFNGYNYEYKEIVE